jgi:hypothetical protein
LARNTNNKNKKDYYMTEKKIRGNRVWGKYKERIT